jgi:hypothetical protein
MEAQARLCILVHCTTRTQLQLVRACSRGGLLVGTALAQAPGTNSATVGSSSASGGSCHHDNTTFRMPHATHTAPATGVNE